jgi:DNA-binding transcriptional ArsR family regulator
MPQASGRFCAFFQIFGHSIRVIIFRRLAAAPLTAGELSHGLPVSRTAVVQHLKLLESVKLLEASPDGRKRVYRVRPQGFGAMAHWIDRHKHL